MATLSQPKTLGITRRRFAAYVRAPIARRIYSRSDHITGIPVLAPFRPRDRGLGGPWRLARCSIRYGLQTGLPLISARSVVGCYPLSWGNERTFATRRGWNGLQAAGPKIRLYREDSAKKSFPTGYGLPRHLNPSGCFLLAPPCLRWLDGSDASPNVARQFRHIPPGPDFYSLLIHFVLQKLNKHQHIPTMTTALDALKA